ncbi:Uncharacterised protein [Klebsiella pneumoniae]|mgnify:CR=1 FL=1|nr:Uncharacterised protein [Klebsiella pneumoniae]SLP12132.1 Uncharacterised protein [Klebsiella pneumoniae]
MDKAAGAADAGFMHHVLDNRPVDRPGYIEEKDGDRHQQNGRHDAADGTRQSHADSGHQQAYHQHNFARQQQAPGEFKNFIGNIAPKRQTDKADYPWDHSGKAHLFNIQMVLLYQIGREPAEKEKQNIVVAEEGKGRYQNNWLFQIITQRVSCLIFYCFQRDFFFFHFINQLKFFLADFFVLFGRISGNEKPRYHPYNTDSENNHKSRAPAECQGQVTDDGAGDRAAQRRACAEKADGGSRLLFRKPAVDHLVRRCADRAFRHPEKHPQHQHGIKAGGYRG